MSEVKIHQSWKGLLENEFTKDYFLRLKEFLIKEKELYVIYPKGTLIFSAFNLTPFEHVKVVLLGQDPYHGEGQANGLSFSVNPGIQLPPSLKNIFKELESDLHIPIPKTGNLEPWARQGVLLLNTTLTVRAKEAGSHQKKGWEIFTDKIIQLISEKNQNIVFLLWGNFAHRKENLIDKNKHLILKAAHPSPLAGGAFFGSKPFSKTNYFLIQKNIKPIDWEIND